MSDAAVPAWIYEPALAIPTATIQQYVLRMVSNHSAIELLVLRGDYAVARFDSIIKLVSQQAGFSISWPLNRLAFHRASHRWSLSSRLVRTLWFHQLSHFAVRRTSFPRFACDRHSILTLFYHQILLRYASTSESQLLDFSFNPFSLVLNAAFTDIFSWMKMASRHSLHSPAVGSLLGRPTTTTDLCRITSSSRASLCRSPALVRYQRLLTNHVATRRLPVRRGHR
jgi:hypothetical protein